MPVIAAGKERSTLREFHNGSVPPLPRVHSARMAMLALGLAAAGFTPPSRPRLARRELLSGAASCLVLSRLPSPAAARVDGIPLYAPSGSAPLPPQGFEVLLPALEQLIVGMTALRDTASAGEWSKVADSVSEPAVVAQGKLIGGLAGILGDDAYTVLSLKNRYLASARKLRETLATRPPPPEASSNLDDMVTILGLIKDLVPAQVVTQARRAPCPKSARAAHRPLWIAPSRCTGPLSGASLRSRSAGGSSREGPSRCCVGSRSRRVMTPPSPSGGAEGAPALGRITFG